MAPERQVNRPVRRSEYKIIAASNAAQRGWMNLVATQRNVMVEAWEFLTATPLTQTPTNSPLRASLATVVRDGVEHERWQHKPSRGGSARIWFYVEGQTVYLEQVHTAHPKETD